MAKPKQLYLFNRKDLVALVADEQIFSTFQLMERERRIVYMHLVKDFKFRFIATILKVSHQMIHKIFHRALEKMKQQILHLLRRRG